MGEAGGVRTMIWSQPQLTSAQATATPSELHATTSGWAAAAAAGGGSGSVIGGGSNPEESAAQMLLNLGQERSRVSKERSKNYVC